MIAFFAAIAIVVVTNFKKLGTVKLVETLDKSKILTDDLGSK